MRGETLVSLATSRARGSFHQGNPAAGRSLRGQVGGPAKGDSVRKDLR